MRKNRRSLPALVLAIVAVLTAGMRNADGWLRASDGEGSTQEDTGVVTSEDVQGSTAPQVLDLTTEPAEEAFEPAEESTEPVAESTEPSEEATDPSREAAEPAGGSTEPAQPEEIPDETEPSEPESGFTVTPVGYSGTYDARSHSASYTVSDPVGSVIAYSIDGGATWSASAPY